MDTPGVLFHCDTPPTPGGKDTGKILQVEQTKWQQVSPHPATGLGAAIVAGRSLGVGPKMAGEGRGMGEREAAWI